ncbi:hypothetical protein B7P43_G01827 [Cryptotermes secundus]|uniref:Zinc finger PHD-type domain-containing protein n=1 Tax=Cryptotermes secundus TaxID=105785 RepID=A0A2J7PPB5_9NEOP|nr:hypothetical protein B7P43_G01827 [Cryptotermes secundus]
MGKMMLCATVIATLLIIGGVELNPGPVDNIVQVTCNGCHRTLKSGTQCATCGQWYHNSCENVKFQVAESGKWNCASCSFERLRVLEDKLKDAQIQIEELKRKNEVLQEQLLLRNNGKDAGKLDTEKVEPGGTKCLVLGDSIIRNVGADKTNMRVECFPGIRANQLRRVIENRNFGCSDTVVIHVGTNELRRSRNLDYVMGEVYDLVNTIKAKFPNSRLVLSGVLRCKGVSWRRVGAANDRFEWIARNLGTTFVDPNSWIRDGDFSRDGLHLNRGGARQLGDLYCRVCGKGGEGEKVRGN